MDSGTPVEQPCDGGIADIESAGIGAEGRQDQALFIADEAAPADPPAPPAERSLGMEMARDFAGRGRGRGDMTEEQGAEDELRLHHAAEIGRRGGIVIAGDPDPAAAADEAGQALAIGAAEALSRAAVMEAVAEADHGLGFVALDRIGEPGQGLGRIVGRQELAAGGEARALLQMEIGKEAVYGAAVDELLDEAAQALIEEAVGEEPAPQLPL